MFSRFGRPVCRLFFVLLGVCYCVDGQETKKVIQSQTQEGVAQPAITLCEVVKNPELFNGKEVTIQAEYVLGFEWSALFSEECPDPDAKIWLEWRGLDEVSAKALKRAYDAGPTYLTVPVYLTVQGTFTSGRHYGHMGAYSYEIVAHKVLTFLKVASESHLTDVEGVDGLDWKTFGISLYRSLTKSWIANMPDSVQKGQEGKNSVRFRVLRDGSVPDDSVAVVSASGTSELDEASLKAIHAAAPLGQLPEKFSQPFISMCTVFYYNPRTKSPMDQSPYSKALFASIGEMDKAYASIDDSMGGRRVRTDYHHMIVEIDPQGLTDGLPEQVGEYHVEYLGNLITRFEKLKKEFPVLKIQRVENTSNILISVYWVSYKKDKLTLRLSGWSEVKLLYDCEKQTFTVSKVTLGAV
jgi:TonB family protein